MSKSRTIWVTGASSGIGEALVKRLARRGDRVAISARSEDKLAEIAKSAPENLFPYPVDVGNRAEVDETVRAIECDLGPLDIAVLNAGTHKPADGAAFDAGDFETLVKVNLLGTSNCLAPLIRTFVGRRRGRIAIVASVAGYRGLPTAAYYGATKAALINLAESLKLDLDPHGVRVQLINPGFVKTPLTDKNEFKMPFLMPVDEAAKRMAEALSETAFEVTFPRRFTYSLKVLRCLPYRLYFPLVARATKRQG
jgi:NAD(P)-dependent dehydrogenase (short-subunit alcohol dehydrogenase family)